MDRPTDRMEGLMEGLTFRPKNTDKQTDLWTDRPVDQQTEKLRGFDWQTNRPMERRNDGQTDRLIE